MTTTLIVARHGNTFEDGEQPRWIGAGTDLPLTAKGGEQARALGFWLKERGLLPGAAFSSLLERARETARIAVAAAGLDLRIEQDRIFNELDYGPDENRTEAEIIARIGEKALRDWSERGIVPPGWSPSVETIRNNWLSFGVRVASAYHDRTVLVVTSGGTGRFAACLAGDVPRPGDFKLATGAAGILRHDGEGWRLGDWNVRPRSAPA